MPFEFLIDIEQQFRRMTAVELLGTWRVYTECHDRSHANIKANTVATEPPIQCPVLYNAMAAIIKLLPAAASAATISGSLVSINLPPHRLQVSKAYAVQDPCSGTDCVAYPASTSRGASCRIRKDYVLFHASQRAIHS
jgi:hypothetical protein